MSDPNAWDEHFTSNQLNRDLVGEMVATGFMSADRVIKSHRAPRSPFVRSVVSVTSALLTVSVGIGVVRVVTSDSGDETHSALAHATSDTSIDTFNVITPSGDDLLDEAMKRRAESEVSRTQRRIVISRTKYVTPVKNGRVTSCWGHRWGRHHAGVDIAAPHGTLIRSVSSGVVKQVGYRYSGMGLTVVVSYGDYMMIYAHASRTLVKVNQRVNAGDVIAKVGATGNATGPHLHLGVAKTRLLGKIFTTLVNPAPWLNDRGVRLARCGT